MRPQWIGIALTALLALLVAACGDDPVSPSNVDHTGLLETCPVLTFDGDLVLSLLESQDDTTLNGIYATNRNAPSRFQLLAGSDLSSPSLTPSGDFLIYLKRGQIQVLDLTVDTVNIFMRHFRFSSVAWLNDTLLVAEYNDRLWIARWPAENSFTFWANGWDPTVVDTGEIVHASAGSPGKTAIVNRRIGELGPNVPKTRVAALTRVRFPSPRQTDSAYVFSLESDSDFTLATQREGDEAYTTVATSRSPRAVFIDSDRFLYTGRNGLFWTYNVRTGETAQY